MAVVRGGAARGTEQRVPPPTVSAASANGPAFLVPMLAADPRGRFNGSGVTSDSPLKAGQDHAGSVPGYGALPLRTASARRRMVSRRIQSSVSHSAILAAWA